MNGDRWARLKAFVAAWYRPIEPGDGYSEIEVARWEERIGYDLPEALREYYLLCGQRKDLNKHQNWMVDPYREGRGYLYFMEENQYCCLWGIPLDRIRQADPPVVVDLNPSHEEDARTWVARVVKVSDTFSEFILSALVVGAYLRHLSSMRTGFVTDESIQYVESVCLKVQAVQMPYQEFMPIYWNEDAILSMAMPNTPRPFEPYVLRCCAKKQRGAEFIGAIPGITWD